MRHQKLFTQNELTERARELLRNPRFLFMVLQKVGELGVVGEERSILRCRNRS